MPTSYLSLSSIGLAIRTTIWLLRASRLRFVPCRHGAQNPQTWQSAARHHDRLPPNVVRFYHHHIEHHYVVCAPPRTLKRTYKTRRLKNFGETVACPKAPLDLRKCPMSIEGERRHTHLENDLLDARYNAHNTKASCSSPFLFESGLYTHRPLPFEILLQPAPLFRTHHSHFHL
ncbi:hypothetical protein CYLTODRAFT_78237 [Cylindrobasidium torrendii FP15055 ss-10]|uniref:Uncharacterized protein n=1 Tax=Cylindrobasidium torrendii FP15055 ss-10 TaxID=1314674 RepID=A0A0D7BQR4_9AGAR|nr:hypothetical protein CYLTODRAFT_78237 [Cylindrobasidium torrendii FP15055 ss-10]